MLASLFAALALMPQEGVALPADCAQAMTTIEMNACADLDRRREASRMARYLAAADERARALDEESPGAHSSAWLDASQSAWTAYAGIVCAGVYDLWKGGTIRTVMASGCWYDLIRERTHRIWADNLVFMDSTAPLLPEPVEPAGASEPLTVD